jgi:hypothetical protein
MTATRSILSIGLMALLAAACASVTRAPDPLLVKAEMASIWGLRRTITITRSGKLVQVLRDRYNSGYYSLKCRNEKQLSPRQFQSILDAAEEAHFGELTDDLAWPGNIVTDEPMYSLEVVMPAGPHEVVTLGVDRDVSTPGLERFRSVWRAVTHFAPVCRDSSPHER